MKDLKAVAKILRETRIKKELSREYVVERLKKMGVSYNQSSLARIEDGTFKTIKPEILKALSQIYMLNIKEMYELAGILDDFMTITDIEGADFKIPIYEFITSGNGEIKEEEFEMEEVYLPNKFREISGLYGINVNGINMEPKFEDGTILVMNPSCIEWEELNEKVVVVEIEGKKYVRQLKYKDYVPYLFSYNEVYRPIKVTDDVKCMGFVIFSIFEFS